MTGIAGQDGFFLWKLLSDRGYRVVGTSRDAPRAAKEFHHFGNRAPEIVTFDYSKPGAFAELLEAEKPELVFNLASFATGQGMFDSPPDMARLNGFFVLEILEAIRSSPRKDAIRFVQASSSEMFGEVQICPQDECTPLWPKSPYGAAKQYAHSMVRIYRQAFGLHASSAILFNHESARRPAGFLTKKVARAAARISLGLENELRLGSLTISRDWGYAPEYMEAMLRMATAIQADDYVVATGVTHTIQDVVELAFKRVALDWTRYVILDKSWARPIESVGLCGNPTKILRRLDWKAKKPFAEIIHELVDFEVESARSPGDVRQQIHVIRPEQN